MSGRALHHDIRGGGPRPPTPKTASPGAHGAIPGHEPPTGRLASHSLRPCAVASGEPGIGMRGRPREPAPIQHGPQEPVNRPRHVVATPEANSPLAPLRPRGGRSGARLTAPAMRLPAFQARVRRGAILQLEELLGTGQTATRCRRVAKSTCVSLSSALPSSASRSQVHLLSSRILPRQATKDSRGQEVGSNVSPSHQVSARCQ